MIPLSQFRQQERTLRERDDVRDAYEGFVAWVSSGSGWSPDGKKHRTGRTFEAALILTALDFADKRVLELGARGSFLGAYLTRDALEVRVSDLFGQPFHDMGGPDLWDRLWRQGAHHPERLFTERQDMMALHYPDDYADVVISISAVEHLVRPSNGDMIAMREMGRVCRPGGFICIGTDVSDGFRKSPGYYYDREAIYERLVGPSGCEPWGAWGLDWDACDQSLHKSGEFWRSDCLLILQQPGAQS